LLAVIVAFWFPIRSFAQARIRRADVFLFINVRSEHEVVLDPAKLISVVLGNALPAGP